MPKKPSWSDFLPLDVVKQYEPLAASLGVSEVARSPRGFLTAYKKARGDPSRLSPEWHSKRRAFIARHMAQVRLNRETLFGRDGALPSRRALALIMWAFFPF